MTPALFIVFFFWCGGDVFCEEGCMVHQSCAAAEAWLRAGLRPDQTLLVSACEAAEGQAAQNYVFSAK